MVEYGYDAWGKNIYTKGSKAEEVGKDNPFRYRGYVYDEETGLYYLRSRQDFFEKINGILGSNIDYSKFGPGEWKYNYKG